MAVRELDPTPRAGLSIGSVETVGRLVLAEVPFAPLVVGGGGCDVGARFWTNKRQFFHVEFTQSVFCGFTYFVW